MKPLNFCIKFNDKIAKSILTSIIDCAHEMFMHGVKNPDFQWNNNTDNTCTLFDFDVYESQDGSVMPFKYATNIVITIRDTTLSDNLKLKIIDIFNDRIELLWVVTGDILCTIPLNKNTEIDEEFIFQLQTENLIMPFSVQDLLMLQEIGSILRTDYSD